MSWLQKEMLITLTEFNIRSINFLGHLWFPKPGLFTHLPTYGWWIILAKLCHCRILNKETEEPLLMEVMVNLFLFSSSSYCISCLCPWYKEISVSLEKRNLQNKKTLFEDTFQNCFIEKNFGLKGTKYFMILSSGFEDNVDWITIAVTSK